MMRVGNGQVMKDFECLNNKECAPYPTEDMELLKDSSHTLKQSQWQELGWVVWS